jgi:plastocyanin domain-containing protein
MSTVEWVVIIAGAAAIVWVNWYFFFAERRSATAATVGGTQEVEIEVKGGYDPGVVRLKRGQPARLVFNRQETSPCSEEIVIPAFGVKQFLAPFKKTTVEILPQTTGSFAMTCGMSMLHGTLVVEG